MSLWVSSQATSRKLCKCNLGVSLRCQRYFPAACFTMITSARIVSFDEACVWLSPREASRMHADVSDKQALFTESTLSVQQCSASISTHAPLNQFVFKTL
eukprot:TRINITY_DN21455_c0_g1_i2.p1 TRINITY_DN21455_c0_g1~~TRINITY_DN21455_c0_g1_i2.p1  ORF type:complete len:100 (-),score=11.36 TRINITY_DN21455_c0_g1_i2:92-391(-)